MKPLNEAKIKELFGDFSFKDNKDGSITIDPVWVKENIATLHTPLVPSIRCHIKIARQLASALYKVHIEGLGHLIKTYEGCWVARHMRWDKKASLSRHSWGTAIDFNAKTNPMGKYSKELEPIATIFKEFGFIWGGDWAGKSCDPMHLEVYSLWE